MTSIPVAICRFSENNFKGPYLKKDSFFLIFYCISEMRMKSKRSCFRTPFRNQRVKGFETVLKSTRHHYFPIFQWIRDNLSWKNSALVASDIFRLFVDTLTPDDKFSRRYMQIFWQQFQKPLSQKGLAVFPFLIAFLKRAWNLENSEKKKRILT